MSGFTKLFHSIIHSSVWQEPPEVCKLWVTILAMADQHGKVDAAVPGLASAAVISITATEDALRRFESPDKYSRTFTPECEGRRIRKVDGGWLIINHAKYRELMSAEARREQNRKSQQTFRDKTKTKKTVIRRNQESATSAEAEAEAEEQESQRR